MMAVMHAVEFHALGFATDQVDSQFKAPVPGNYRFRISAFGHQTGGRPLTLSTEVGFFGAGVARGAEGRFVLAEFSLSEGNARPAKRLRAGLPAVLLPLEFDAGRGNCLTWRVRASSASPQPCAARLSGCSPSEERRVRGKLPRPVAQSAAHQLHQPPTCSSIRSSMSSCNGPCCARRTCSSRRCCGTT